MLDDVGGRGRPTSSRDELLLVVLEKFSSAVENQGTLSRTYLNMFGAQPFSSNLESLIPELDINKRE
jgi:hypothetical protein